MITDADVVRIPGSTVFGADGEKIGKAGVVYRDDESGRPDWMTVQTGLFGTSESFVPLAEADLDGGDIRVPYDKARVKDAPRVDAAGHLDISEEDRLFEHYGLAGSGQHAGHDTAGQDRRDGTPADTRDLDLDRDEATAGSGRRDSGLRDSDDSGLWRSQHDTHRAEHRADTPVDARAGSRADLSEGGREDADRGRRTEGSGLSSSPVSGAAGGAAAGAAGAAAAGRRPRLSQWVLVERSAVIEVSEEDAQRLTGTDR